MTKIVMVIPYQMVTVMIMTLVHPFAGDMVNDGIDSDWMGQIRGSSRLLGVYFTVTSENFRF